jgi:hypothetical protein
LYSLLFYLIWIAENLAYFSSLKQSYSPSILRFAGSLKPRDSAEVATALGLPESCTSTGEVLIIWREPAGLSIPQPNREF